MLVRCDAGHDAIDVPGLPFVHDDGTTRINYQCPECRLTLPLREDMRAAIFEPFASAGLEHVSLQTLTLAVQRGFVRR